MVTVRGTLMRHTRAIGLVVIVLALAWLAWDRSARNPWLDTAFVQKVSAPIPAGEREELTKELSRVIRAADVTVPLNLNRPFRADALNLYITRSAVSDVTGCRPGDARYVAEPRVMLIDEGVVWPVSAAVSYGAINVESPPNGARALKIWMHFALLHELGHRKLHSGIRFRFRPVSDPVVEREADLFALDALERLATTGEYDTDSEFSVLRVSKDLTGRDRSAARVASLIQSLSVTLLFGGSQFSPFHADTAHAAFVARFRPRLFEALAETTTPAARSYVLLALAYLDRVEETGQLVTAEIYTTSPIRDVAFDGADLIVTAAGLPPSTGRAYRIAASGLRRSDGRAARVLLPNAAMVGITSATGSTTHTASPRDGIVLTGTGASAMWQLLDGHGSVIAERTDAALRSDVNTQYAIGEQQLANCLTDVVLRDGHIDVAFTCSAEAEFGRPPDSLFIVGELDPHDLHARSLNAVYGPRRMDNNGEAQTLLDMRVNGVRQTYVATDTVDDERHARRFEIRVAPLRPGGGMPIASMPLVVDWIPAGGVLHEWLRVSHPPVIGCTDEGDGLGTCTEFLDSVFAFDARARTLTTLFYPAGAKMARGPGRQRAFYAPSGHKVFVVQAANAPVQGSAHPGSE